ncbi:hypothetical protein GGR19_002468 [Croceicoccus naphthovorans]|nr:hypothetical protein BV96_04021 [Sphingomonas paucimobilis]MBB3991034.1 hypothetical protein [Croceicoccus naphthovorans]
MGAEGFPFSWQIIENPARTGYDPASARSPAMDHNRYGLDGQPLYPRPGHFDHVTGQPLPTFRGGGRSGNYPLALPLAVIMAALGAFLAYMSNMFG